MKHKILLGRVCAAALLWTGAGFAIDASGLIDSSQLKEKKVTDPRGADLGQVDRLILEGDTGRVRYAVIGIGNPSNPTEREIVVPWRELHVEQQPPQDVKIVLNATRDQVEQAPAFKRGDEQSLASADVAESISSYWAALVPPGPHRNESGLPFTPAPGETTRQAQPSDKAQPQVQTEETPRSPSRGTENYYDKNRNATAPSATEQNNSPAGEATVPPPESTNQGSPLRPQNRPDTPGTGSGGIPVPGVPLPDQTNRSLDQAADQDATPVPPPRTGE